MKNSEVI